MLALLLLLSPAAPPPSGDAAVALEAAVREADAAVRLALSRPFELAPGRRTVASFVQEIGEEAGVPIFLDRNELRDLSISPDEMVRLSPGRRPYWSHLRLHLEDVVGDLTCVVRDATLVVTTVEDAESKLQTRVYDATGVATARPPAELTAFRAAAGAETQAEFDLKYYRGDFDAPGRGLHFSERRFGGGAGCFQIAPALERELAEQERADLLKRAARPRITLSRRPRAADAFALDELADLVRAASPGVWAPDDGYATVTPMVLAGRPSLVIRASERTHADVAAMLAVLRAAAAAAAGEVTAPTD